MPLKWNLFTVFQLLVGEGNGNPLQYSCLENPVDRGDLWAAVHGVTQSRTRLKRLSMHACIGKGNGNPLQCPRDKGAWWAAVYGAAQSWTWLKRLSSSSSRLLWWAMGWAMVSYGMVSYELWHELWWAKVREILQARILELVAMLSSKRSSQPKDRTCVSCIADQFFTA